MLFGIDHEELTRREPMSKDDLRYLTKLPQVCCSKEGAEFTGVVVDLETTGVDTTTDEITSLAFVKFEFNDDLTEINPYEAGIYYNCPEQEIPEDVEELTGLTKKFLAGREITQRDFDHVFDGMDIAVAHFAQFDRKFIDRYYHSDIHWACTVEDLHLRGLYQTGTSSLGSVMAQAFGYWFPHHEALADSWACYHLVADNLQELMTAASEEESKVVAWGAPFSSKDQLKDRKYAWDPDSKVWWKKMKYAALSEEIDFLTGIGSSPEIIPISQNSRFKD